MCPAKCVYCVCGKMNNKKTAEEKKMDNNNNNNKNIKATTTSKIMDVDTLNDINTTLYFN